MLKDVFMETEIPNRKQIREIRIQLVLHIEKSNTS